MAALSCEGSSAFANAAAARAVDDQLDEEMAEGGNGDDVLGDENLQ